MVVGDGERPLEPALVQAGAVRVAGFDDIEGVIQLPAQLLVFRQLAAEKFQHHRSDGLVGMGRAIHQRILAAAADLQTINGMVPAGAPHLSDRHHIGIVLRQLQGAGVHFIHRQKGVIRRNLCENILNPHALLPPLWVAQRNS